MGSLRLVVLCAQKYRDGTAISVRDRTDMLGFMA